MASGAADELGVRKRRARSRGGSAGRGAVIATVLLIAACQAGTPSSPPATQAAATSAIGEPCSLEPGATCFMFGGQYHSSRFAGGMSFRLIGERWTNDVHAADLISLSIEDDWLIFVSGAPRMGPGDDLQAVEDPAVAQSLLASMADLTVTRVADAPSIDGLASVAFDVVNTGSETATLWRYPRYDGRFVLDPGVSTRVFWVDKAGSPVLVALEAPTIAFPAYLLDMEPVIASLDFD